MVQELQDAVCLQPQKAKMFALQKSITLAVKLLIYTLYICKNYSFEDNGM